MRLIPLAILSALLGVTYWIGATIFTAKIEQDITDRTNSAIAAYKPAVELEVDGRDVTLKGHVSDESSRKAALSTVDEVYGVRATRDSLSVMGPYKVHAKYENGQQFVINGTVDDLQANKDFEKSIAPLEAVSNLTAGARPLINSPAKIALAAGAVSRMNNGQLWIDEEQLRITGEAPNASTKAQIEQHLQSQHALIDPLKLTTEIQVAAAAVTTTAYCQNIATHSEVNEMVLFDIDTAYIKDMYKEPLVKLIDMVKECAPDTEGNIIVEAHADQDGSEDYNYLLSQSRADEVTKFLLLNGLEAKHIASFAYGETRPVASNESHADKAFNRRVEVRFLNDAVKLDTLNQTIISTQSSE